MNQATDCANIPRIRQDALMSCRKPRLIEDRCMDSNLAKDRDYLHATPLNTSMHTNDRRHLRSTARVRDNRTYLHIYALLDFVDIEN